MAEGEHGEHTQNSDRRSDHNSHSSSDEDEDDMEVNHESVGNYWLEYEDETPVSFTILPYFKEEENHDGFLKFNMENNVFRIPNTEKPVYLRGINNNGMSLYLKALSWKLELKEDTKPIFYLQAEKNWYFLLRLRCFLSLWMRNLNILKSISSLNWAMRQIMGKFKLSTFIQNQML